jgi:hypothetical protein
LPIGFVDQGVLVRPSDTISITDSVFFISRLAAVGALGISTGRHRRDRGAHQAGKTLLFRADRREAQHGCPGRHRILLEQNLLSSAIICVERSIAWSARLISFSNCACWTCAIRLAARTALPWSDDRQRTSHQTGALFRSFSAFCSNVCGTGRVFRTGLRTSLAAPAHHPLARRGRRSPPRS